MKISIIVLNYRQSGLVKQCLKGIEQSRISVPYEVIVVDNCSGDNCVSMVREHFPQAKIIALESNNGYAVGNNAGIRQAQGDYVVIMNPDVALVDGTIEKMLDFFARHSQAGIVGPKLIHPDGSIQFSCRSFPTLAVPLFRRTLFRVLPGAQKSLSNYLMSDWGHRQDRRVDWLFGAFIMVKKEVFEKIGLFDERFFLYYEDLDFCRRVWEHGYEVWYFAGTELVHYHHRLSARSEGIWSLFNKATLIHIQSGIKYFIKYRGRARPVHPS